MTKELNFNIEDIRKENEDFYRWKEEMEKRDKTFAGYHWRYIAPADDWTESLIKVDHFSQEGKKVGGK